MKFILQVYNLAMKNSFGLNFCYRDLGQTQVLSESLRPGSNIKEISKNDRNNAFLNWNL